MSKILDTKNELELIRLLEIASKRAGELADMPMAQQQKNYGLDFDLAQVKYPIDKAINILKLSQDDIPTDIDSSYKIKISELYSLIDIAENKVERQYKQTLEYHHKMQNAVDVIIECEKYLTDDENKSGNKLAAECRKLLEFVKKPYDHAEN